MELETNLSSAKLMSVPEIQTDAHAQSPLYQKIYLIIRDRILSGEYPDQSLLPSEHELAELFGVSRITAKRALNEISAEGLCDRKRGKGSCVTYKPATTPLKTDVQGLLDYLFQMNLATEGFVLEFDYVDASAEIATVMKIAEGEEIQRSVRVRHLEGTPFSYLIASRLRLSKNRSIVRWLGQRYCHRPANLRQGTLKGIRAEIPRLIGCRGNARSLEANKLCDTIGSQFHFAK